MSHRIFIVDDDALPEGHDFVLVHLPTGPRIFYRRSALDVGPLEDSWRAWRVSAMRYPPKEPTACGDALAGVVDLVRRMAS